MFKWPGAPSPGAPKHELADFAEMICWRDNYTSATDLSRVLGRLSENDYYVDGVPEDDPTERTIEEGYEEIELRLAACRDGYPFVIGGQGRTLQVSQETGNPRHLIYKYLLLSTRLNMSNNRDHAGIDGALLFERLAAEAARQYFGDRAESLVFGTAAGTNNFETKVNDLCNRLNEGGGFQNHSLGRTTARDGKLDVVVWKPFADSLPGKLIGFGQCKTGTNYRDSLTQLQPGAFREKWLVSALVVPPVRMFFIAEAPGLSQQDRYGISNDAGLLFDRCRIIDFCDAIGADTMADVREWTMAAAKAVALPGI